MNNRFSFVSVLQLAAAGVIGVLTLVGCSPQPTINTSVSAERTYDGLYPIENTLVDRAWARADLDLGGYTKIKFEAAGINFRPTRTRTGSRMAHGSSETAFHISQANRERLRATFAEAFRAEMPKLERFEITDQSGPDVLLVRGALVDVVSHVPEEPIDGADIYLDTVGEATLLIEMVDSETGAVLLRAADRRAAEYQNLNLPSNIVTNWQEVRRLADFWAGQLRQRLDDIANQVILAEDAI